MVQAKQSFLKKIFQEKGQKKSYFFMLLSSIAWVSGYIYGNEHKFSPFQTNLSRSIVMTVVMYIICRGMGLSIQFQSPKSWRVLLQRHVGFVVQGFVLAGVQFYLPLGVAHTISSVGPIITILMQVFIYKKGSIHGSQLRGCILGFLGILLCSNGKYIYQFFNQDFQFESDFANYAESSYGVTITAIAILILAMVLWSYGLLLTQQAQCHAFQIVFHFGVSNLFVSSICYLTLTQKRPMQQMYQSLIFIGLFLVIAETSFTLSLNLSENIGLSNIAAFFSVVVGYFYSIFRYNQSIEIVSLLGTLLVVFGVSTVILAKQQILDDNKLNQSLKQEIEMQKKQDKF